MQKLCLLTASQSLKRFSLVHTTINIQQQVRTGTSQSLHNNNAPNILFHDFETMEVIADGLQIALLGETRKETLHTAVELVFTIKLERTRERERAGVKATERERLRAR